MTELLERAGQLDALSCLLDEARQGTGRLAFIGGEAGAGKSAVLQRFCDSVASSARVLIGYCDPLAAPRPLGPLIDVAPALGGDVRELLGAGERSGLFEATLAQLAGGARPTLLALEDLQWADESTLDLIRFLGRRVPGVPILLLGTYRDDDAALQRPLRVVMGDLATATWVRRISIPPLSEAAVRTLAVGTPVDATQLYKDTSGNAFLVTEVLAARAVGIPAAVSDAVVARAARLSPAARQALEAAAVIGTRIEPSLILQVGGVDALALHDCVTAGMLRFSPPSFTFRHELARQAVLLSMSAHARARLHADVLHALRAGSSGPELLARLSDHAEEAGDAAAVLEFAPAAGEHAAAQRSHREAALQYARALRFADRIPPQARARLLESRARECYLTDQLAEATEAQQEALEIWRRAGDRVREGDNLRWLSRLAWHAGRNADAQEASRAALDLLQREAPGAELAMALSNESRLRMLASDVDGAIAWGDRALEVARRLGATECIANTLVSIGSALLCSGDEAGGIALLEEGLEEARTGGFADDAARAWINLGTSLVMHYDFARGERYLDEGIAYCDELGLDARGLYMQAYRAMSLFLQGRWDETIDVATAVLTRHGLAPVTRVMALLPAVRARIRRGDDCAALLDEARALATPTGEVQRLAPVAAARAELAWFQGRSVELRSEIEEVLEAALAVKNAWAAGELAYWLWRAGHLGAATDGLFRPFALQIAGDWRPAAEEWERLGCPYEAALALLDGDQAAVQAAHSVFERLGARPAAAEAARRLRAMGVRGVRRGPRPSTSADAHGMTPREREVLALLTLHLTNGEIAARLFLSERTVAHHVSAILGKLGVHTRVQAANASRHGQPAAPR